MRAEPDKLQAHVVRLAVDQDQVGSDVAVAVIAPLAAERVIEISPRQRLVLGQHSDGFEQLGVEAFAVPSGFFALCSRVESGWCV